MKLFHDITLLPVFSIFATVETKQKKLKHPLSSHIADVKAYVATI
jgi:hypothetical protein